MIPDSILGKVVSVTKPKIFDAPRGNKTIEKDYYHLIIDLDAIVKSDDPATRLAAMQSMWSTNATRVKKAKIYFPVTGNISSTPDIIRKKKKTGRASKSITKILNRKTGEWIQYPLFNPQKIIGHKIEARGNIVLNDDGTYYVNKLTELKIF